MRTHSGASKSGRITGRAPSATALQAIVHAYRTGDAAGAKAAARRELDRGVEHPLLLHLRAVWLHEQGRNVEALSDLERARRMAPKDMGVLMAMGLVLTNLNRHLDARAVFKAAAALRPDIAAPRLQVGAASDQLADVEEAWAAYEAVLRLEPANVVAHVRLAGIATQQGQWQVARNHAQHALRVDPLNPAAHVAHARADLEEGLLEEAEARLAALLARPMETDHHYRAELTLGLLRERQHRHAEAFAAWTRGNDVAYRHYYASGRTPVREPAALLQWIADYFAEETPWPPTPPVGVKGPAKTHVFLMGFIRSGTTLLEQVLAAHPEVVALEEKEVLNAALAAYRPTSEGLRALREATDENLAPLRQAYWRDVAAYGAKPTGKVFLDKMPLNVSRLPLIARLFPEAKILFALRDPRDVVLSCFRLPLRPDGIPPELLSVEGAGRFYAAHMSMAQAYRAKLPLQVLQLRHEDLLDDIEGEIGRICGFIGIDLRPEMLEFHKATRKVATPSASQLRAGLNRSGAGRWTRYARELEPALRHLDPWVERFGYAAA